ncbi:MAG: phosphoribosylaminoimidazolesuccinocarboxamide synthase [Chloroflexota bacterium]|nr:phosphoribosylaminoimidazolesuccinocarboxamide synthase [Chloroflexota bacterium]
MTDRRPNPTAVLTTDLPLDIVSRGKVRDTYRLDDDSLLMVATDRLSAFDVVMPVGIPRKGEVLTALAKYWFAATAHLMPNHILPMRDLSRFGAALPDVARRSMVVRRAERISVECVVRGYLAGSGWAEYKSSGTLAGEPLPLGLVESDALPRPAFTPAIKNDAGHDENVSRARLAELVGRERAGELERASLALYAFAADKARERGVIVADTKFEFGLVGGRLTLIDEALTPDSSRFWPAASYRPGGPQESFDKQPVRDYLAGLDWDRRPPGPALPDAVVAGTTARYLEAYRLLTGRDLDEDKGEESV